VRTGLYILDGHTPVAIEDIDGWNHWMFKDKNLRIVKQDQLGPYWISTVFLGLGHSWRGGPPIQFETRIFCDDELNNDFKRYHTWDEAEAGHAATLAYVKSEWCEPTASPQPLPPPSPPPEQSPPEAH
jgi:hypothetical protein